MLINNHNNNNKIYNVEIIQTGKQINSGIQKEIQKIKILGMTQPQGRHYNHSH